ncbi:MAG TPA: ATP-binding protein [Vicinamibacterales bacterium]|jgi:signal transduction histidine kinase/CheY-like chemotaxis protein
MRRALPLSVQLLLAFLALLIGLATVLTRAAYTALASTLRTDAGRQVSLESETRAQSLSQLFEFRRQHAENFLGSLTSVCAESSGLGRLGWAPDCVAPMLADFRRSEEALGALLTYRGRVLRRAGDEVGDVEPEPNALAKPLRVAGGAVEYVLKAGRGDLTLTLRFGDDDVQRLFASSSPFRRSAEVFLLDADGTFLASSSPGASAARTQVSALAGRCRAGSATFVGVDFTGTTSFQSLQPLAALGGGCVGARLDYSEAIAPAQALYDDLVRRVIWFVLGGILLSLVAAHWISAPIRRLAEAARRLQSGNFQQPVPIGGPSEVRALGRSFGAMSSELEELVGREQAARLDAEKANRAKDDFLATVSHELRTPLNAVLAWAQVVKAHDLPPAELRHAIDVIESSARAQSRLVDDLLDVSRIVSGRMRMLREAIPLAHVVEAALEQVRPQAQGKQLEIHSDLRDPSLVFGDPRRLEQVVWNLLSNAIKFSDGPGRVSVVLGRSGRNLVLTVSDAGAGIPADFLPHAFEWFRQADGLARGQSGLGLGLGIVRHIVELHHGSVRAESAGEGRGSTFTVTLPAYEPSSTSLTVRVQNPALPGAAPRSLARARILLVEDDEHVREVLRLTLQRAGASVDTAATAGEARREMQGGPPDVLISDIRMPKEDGYSLIRSLRRAGIVTPAIALTSYARQEDADEARAAGFQIHLAKPIDEGRLLAAVASLLGGTVH